MYVTFETDLMYVYTRWLRITDMQYPLILMVVP
jgi:hypothetical protein